MRKLIIKAPLSLQETADRSQSTQSSHRGLKTEKSHFTGRLARLQPQASVLPLTDEDVGQNSVFLFAVYASQTAQQMAFFRHSCER